MLLTRRYTSLLPRLVVGRPDAGAQLRSYTRDAWMYCASLCARHLVFLAADLVFFDVAGRRVVRVVGRFEFYAAFVLYSSSDARRGERSEWYGVFVSWEDCAMKGCFDLGVVEGNV